MTTGFTYAEVGATDTRDRAPFPPAGFRALEREAVVGRGRGAFERSASAVRHWEVQRRSGMRVDRDGEGEVRAGESVTLRIPFGPFRVSAPARVVYVVDEPRTAGFAYGTLAGHPEIGEEAFMVHWDADDRVVFRVRAFWRASGQWRLVLPAVRLAQLVYTRRYLRVLSGASTTGSVD
ncbi:uncharacterized protein (UPF0548 family) [Diaminobutyricimonas aerilata]|uniref:Uncharacterized protein (UPF0548 family) n=1 Tax=Diaminobutyricimonas aerilata TaxID=1162967 RepID=A0A2M9CJC1_9MICO|nr:DUF1990 domain-containing protein [Diaminobutyricimonas aerilata]PJJ72011.1 uncharacterized protein (UPF0548 family) [Diaminobutyricimonas aerilata]